MLFAEHWSGGELVFLLLANAQLRHAFPAFLLPAGDSLRTPNLDHRGCRPGARGEGGAWWLRLGTAYHWQHACCGSPRWVDGGISAGSLGELAAAQENETWRFLSLAPFFPPRAACVAPCPEASSLERPYSRPVGRQAAKVLRQLHVSALLAGGLGFHLRFGNAG